MPPIRSVQWSHDGRAVRVLDQRKLPREEVHLELRSVDEVRDAILTLAVRGAPNIGIAAAMGLVVSMLPFAGEERHAFTARLNAHARILAESRPTAVNLGWALARMQARAEQGVAQPSAKVLDALRAEATAILDEDRAMCDAIGRHALGFVPDGARVLTHCNTGALATAGIGTAVAPIYLAHAAGRRISVLASETRPLLQGSRLTAWELSRAGVPVTVVTEGAVASLMRAGEVDVVLVGADRVAANGDVANKVGTYPLAIAAHRHKIPFYVCAPWSTVDRATPNGAAIVIEERSPAEVTSVAGVAIAPDGVGARNPAFDVTPADLITAIVTDKGVYRAPFSFTY